MTELPGIAVRVAENRGAWRCPIPPLMHETAMRRFGGGSIVNVASDRSIMAGDKTIQYGTAKAAVAGLTGGLAIDHSPEGIRVNAVCQGPIFTPFHERRLEAAGQTVAQYNDGAAVRTN